MRSGRTRHERAPRARNPQLPALYGNVRRACDCKADLSWFSMKGRVAVFTKRDADLCCQPNPESTIVLCAKGEDGLACPPPEPAPAGSPPVERRARRRENQSRPG